ADLGGRGGVAGEPVQQFLGGPRHLDGRLVQEGDQRRQPGGVAGGEQSLGGAEADIGVGVGKQLADAGAVGGAAGARDRQRRGGAAQRHRGVESGGGGGIDLAVADGNAREAVEDFVLELPVNVGKKGEQRSGGAGGAQVDEAAHGGERDVRVEGALDGVGA